MRRREFITLIGVAAAWPLAVRAQSERMRRIGVLMTEDPQRRWPTVGGLQNRFHTR